MKLTYGQTPFDFMSEDELRSFARRAYSAMLASRSALKILASGSETNDPYFGANGTGGVAAARLDAVLAPLDPCEEKAYRAFYRDAGDLLFPEIPVPESRVRYICPACRVWCEGRENHPEIFKKPDCPAKMRRMTLADVVTLGRPSI